MLNTILIVLRTISLIFGGHEQVALENLALREQLGIFQRSVRHPKIRQKDRLFWVYLQKVWKQWRSELVIVRPETVLDWQRKRFKRYWCQLSLVGSSAGACNQVTSHLLEDYSLEAVTYVV